MSENRKPDNPITSALFEASRSMKEKMAIRKDITTVFTSCMEEWSDEDILKALYLSVLDYQYFQKQAGISLQRILSIWLSCQDGEYCFIKEESRLHKMIQIASNDLLTPIFARLREVEGYWTLEKEFNDNNILNNIPRKLATQLSQYVAKRYKEIWNVNHIDYSEYEEGVPRQIAILRNMDIADMEDPRNAYRIVLDSEWKYPRVLDDYGAEMMKNYSDAIRFATYVGKEMSDWNRVVGTVSEYRFIVARKENIVDVCCIHDPMDAKQEDLSVMVLLLADMYHRYELDDILYYEVKGEYHRDAITSGYGDSYIDTKIKEVDTRYIEILDQSTNRIAVLPIDKLDDLKRLIPEKEKEFVEQMERQKLSEKLRVKPEEDNDIMKKFADLKALKENGFITEEEYETKRKELLSKI